MLLAIFFLYEDYGDRPKILVKNCKNVFFVEKASSGMGEMRPKILGGYEYRTPLMGGQGEGDDRDWPWISPI